MARSRHRLVGRAARGGGGRGARRHAVPLRQPRRVLTEKAGRINLGLEGTLVMGAMSGYGTAYLTGSPWLGVLVAGVVGSLFGALHAGLCSLPRVNDIAVGIALMLFGTGLAFYLGKPFIQPQAPMLPAIALGGWSNVAAVRDALRINALFIVGVALAPAILWALRSTRWGMIVRMVGDSADAARAMGYSVDFVRFAATVTGGFLAGDRRLVPVALLPGQLERRPVERPGHHRRGAGDLRALEPDELLLRVAAVRRRRRARPGAAIGRRHLGLLPLQRRALFPDPVHHGADLVVGAPADRRAGRAQHHPLRKTRHGPALYRRRSLSLAL